MTTGRRVAIVTGGSRGLGRGCAIVVNDLHDPGGALINVTGVLSPDQERIAEVIALLAGI
jgi:NAD(P)-dependent dehydrogenase (short-subunit alcohol dehydrogenase family)